MQDKIIARRHNSYRLRAGGVAEVGPGTGPLLQAGIGAATMEEVSMEWDDGRTGGLVRRFPVEVERGQRLYAVMVESGVSVHPDRPVFLFNAGNGQQHREVNAPPVRTRAQLATDRLPLVLAAIVAGGFLSIYGADPKGARIAECMVVLLAALAIAWCVLTLYDVRQNRRRAERLEDELSAAREAVDAMNADIAERRAASIGREPAPAVVADGPLPASSQDAGG
jgi:hypothetical protein